MSTRLKGKEGRPRSGKIETNQTKPPIPCHKDRIKRRPTRPKKTLLSSTPWFNTKKKKKTRTKQGLFREGPSSTSE